MKELKLWWIRTFKVITAEKAEKLGLVFYRNIWGDEINMLNCRSLWKDNNNKEYRVHELVDDRNITNT